MRALILGGGAAKGYAHIGVLKYLEILGVKPDMVVGASMGALVGGFYAAGVAIGNLESIAIGIDKPRKKRLFPLRISKSGLFATDNIVKLLRKHLDNLQIEDLPVHYASVATDLEHHSQVVISRGSLIDAIQASISIPAVFAPHQHQGHVLVDGGFVSPVPVEAARSLGATRIIAVNVLRKFDYPLHTINQVTASGRTYSMKNVLFKIIDYATSRLIDYEADRLEHGLLIHINTDGIGLSQFEKGREAIARGYQQVQQHRKDILRIFKDK